MANIGNKNGKGQLGRGSPQSTTMILRSLVCVAFISRLGNSSNGVNCYSLSPALITSRRAAAGRWARPSMLQLRRVVRSWEPTPTKSVLLSSFYDDFEEFGELGGGSNDSNSGGDGGEKSKEDGEVPKAESTGGSVAGDNSIGSSDDAVMQSLRARMNDLSNQEEADDEDEEEEEEEDEDDEDDDVDSGSALPDLEGNTISSIDDLIGFAQAKAREKKKDTEGSGDVSTGGGTWEDENWARSVPLADESTGEDLDFSDILEGGVVLIANPAKFCSDLADDDKPKDRKILGGLFDDPFPTSASLSNSISPALLAKFGITLPPSPDLGPDRRADLLPVVLLTDRDALKGCQAVLMNRRTGNLMGDLPPSLFDSVAPGDDDIGDGSAGFTPHPLSAFMIQPLWWAGSSPGGNAMGEGGSAANRGGGVKAIDMVHACPYVNGSIPLGQSDGLYWGGNPVQAQQAMKDSRLEKPLSGFDFKFFIQSTVWLPSQLEQEIRDGTWYLATVSKEVLFRSRDRLGAKRAKPLWTEIIELLGDDYKHIRDQLYGEEEE